nr:immunoglobulin light chain junction region [Macaca mulatta]
DYYCQVYDRSVNNIF